jgi:hypothetical protein
LNSAIESFPRVLASIIVATLLLGACTEQERSPSARPKKANHKSEKQPDRARKKLKERKPTQPKKAIVLIEARGDAKRLTQRAIEDLKQLGFWDDLTKKIYAVRVSSREGSINIPTDGHLADALWTYYRNERTGELGDLCDLLMFTKAVKNDVANQAYYYSQGRLDHPPPTLEQFWAVLMAHELAHCTNRGQRGEHYSTAWENRVLEGFGIDRVGS